MSAKTKIWVFHMKELVYTAVFIGLGIVFLILMIFMFASDRKQETAAEIPSRYTAGVYTASMTLGGNPVEIAVTVDEDYISSIHFRQLDETVSAMYPLMEPALDALSEQILESQSLENLSYSEESQYTSLMLMSAIRNALEKQKTSNALPVLDERQGCPCPHPILRFLLPSIFSQQKVHHASIASAAFLLGIRSQICIIDLI